MSLSEGDIDLDDGYLTLGNPAFGTNSNADDADFFTVYLKAGVEYDFMVMGLGVGADYAAFMGLYSPQGSLLDTSQALKGDYQIDGLNFTPASSGVFTVGVLTLEGAGIYVLDVNLEDNSADDYRADQVASPLLAGSAVAGKLEIANDSDGFRLHTEAGQRYYVESKSSIELFVDVQDQTYQSLVASDTKLGQASFVAEDDDGVLVLACANLSNKSGSYTLFAGETYTNKSNLIIGSGGNDKLVGSTRSDEIHGSWGKDSLDGGKGNDYLFGGSGSDADVLKGGAGSDWLFGGKGSDKLTGGKGADTFVVDSASGRDTITDFVSGTDSLDISRAAIKIGDGDLRVEGEVARSSPGGFGVKAELVVFHANAADLSASSAAKVIGSAKAAYHVGQTALFVVDDGHDSGLYLFKSADANAKVSAGELTLFETLDGTASTSVADYWFAA